jgi:hypothetical protein
MLPLRRRGDHLDRVPPLGDAARGDDDLGAVQRKRTRDRLADAGVAACDHGHLVAQSIVGRTARFGDDPQIAVGAGIETIGHASSFHRELLGRAQKARSAHRRVEATSGGRESSRG